MLDKTLKKIIFMMGGFSWSVLQTEMLFKILMLKENCAITKRKDDFHPFYFCLGLSLEPEVAPGKVRSCAACEKTHSEKLLDNSVDCIFLYFK